LTYARYIQPLVLLAAVQACVLGCAGPSIWQRPGCACPYGSQQPYGAAQPFATQQSPGMVIQNAPPPTAQAPTIQLPAGQPTIPSTIPASPYRSQKPPIETGATNDGGRDSGDELIVRGQSPAAGQTNPWADYSGGSDEYRRGPTPVSGGPPVSTQYQAPYNAPPAPQPTTPYGQPYQYGQPSVVAQPGAVYQTPPTYAQPQLNYQPGPGGVTGPPLPPPPPAGQDPTGTIFSPPPYPGWNPQSVVPGAEPDALGTPAPLDIFVEETRTGRFMFGVAVNSDAGVTGQVTVDERNFDITRVPTSWDDILSGNAFRGAGQGFRIEAQPGSQVQRYLVSFTEPYLFGSNISMNASAFYFDRNYFDWDESRYGGRLGLGYRLTPDLSVAGSFRAENVSVYNPRVLGVPELDAALGRNDIYSGKASITHDTRDLPFAPTEGHLIEFSFEQAFGSFSYPRAEVDFAQYWKLRERPDGSGRHVLAYSTKVGFSGSDTPIFENYFAGGFSTLRGFAFRGASPVDMGVRVGGEFRWINSLEYIFPLTADDMLKGIVFCDFGTVERDIALRGENFRVAPGFGLRINVPALGPAPLAFDFAFPVAMADTDDEQVFSFFFGATRQ
jgi:outer membrane protein insertion porin family